MLPPSWTGSDLILHGREASQRLELQAQARVPPFTLMAQAGWALARLGQALAPHTRRAWVLAGPGNNGGDGLVAATHWHQQGWEVRVSLLADPAQLPPDAQRAWQQALSVGVPMGRHLPDTAGGWPEGGLLVDALLGLGQSRAPQGEIAESVNWINQRPRGWHVLAVDLPTGLCADTGRSLGVPAVHADTTLSLLTLKPGLFTGDGRDLAGDIWLDRLGVAPVPADGPHLVGAAEWHGLNRPRLHRQHKGSFGDVWVVGGDQGMLGAAWLAARAALAAGAGRVFLAPLAPQAPELDTGAPEVMVRPVPRDAHTWSQATVVCGCGGGAAITAVLPSVLAQAGRLLLDADALNAVATHSELADALRSRQGLGLPTVLTPHPLEAARLLGCSAGEVQADRPAAARAVAERLGALTLLKGSGTLVARPDTPGWSINPTGSARLAMPGSGDVLAGWIGGLWAGQPPGVGEWDTAAAVSRAGAWLHGLAGEGAEGHPGPATASQLIAALQAARQRPAT